MHYMYLFLRFYRTPGEVDVIIFLISVGRNIVDEGRYALVNSQKERTKTQECMDIELDRLKTLSYTRLDFNCNTGKIVVHVGVERDGERERKSKKKKEMTGDLCILLLLLLLFPLMCRSGQQCVDCGSDVWQTRKWRWFH